MKNILSKFTDSNEPNFRLFLFVLTLVFILFLFPRQTKFKYEFTKGKPWLHESIIAPFDFSILKSDNELSKERKIVASQHLPIYNYSETIFEIKAEDFTNDFETKWVSKYGKLASSQKNKLVNFGYNYLKDIYSKGIIQLNNSFDFQYFSQVLLKSESLAQRRDISDFYTVNSAANKIQQLSGTEYKFLVPLLLAAVEQNILFDKLATDELLSSELSNISTTKGLVVSGQVIINKGELVDAQKYQVLLSLKQKYEGAVWEKSSYLLVLFGQFILVGISLLMLWLFLRQYRNRILENTTKMSLILSLVVIMVLMSSIVLSLAVDWIYCIPFCILPIVLKAFFDNRVALFVHLITILIIGFIMPNGFEFVFLQLIAGIISILTVIKMYKRAQLFMSVIKVMGVYLLLYIALSITHDASFSGIQGVKLLQFTISGALTIFAYPIVFLFEKIFCVLLSIFIYNILYFSIF